MLGKYFIIKTLHTGNGSCVYLVRHVSLNSLRIIKVISKKSPYGNHLVREAYILKDLNHKGVPIVYDIEEDVDNVYIIEEYIEGESLQSYVSKKLYLSNSEAILIMKDLCQTVQYLHNKKPLGLLHLDIKPENIIVSKENVRLIDYGNAVFVGEEWNITMGSKGYAPPEQYKAGCPTYATDIYSIGVVFLYMLTSDTSIGAVSKIPDKYIKSIIERCLKSNPKERYKNISELSYHIDMWNEKNVGQISLKIGVVGTKPGIGTTHIALLLTKMFANQGYTSVYIEENFSKDAFKILEFHKKTVSKTGVAVVQGCPIIPNFNQAVNVNNNVNYQIKILDYGSDRENKYETDILVVVGSAADYEMDKTVKFYEEIRRNMNAICVINLYSKGNINLKNHIKQPDTYAMPFVESDNVKSKELKIIVNRILNGRKRTWKHKIRSRLRVISKIKKN